MFPSICLTASSLRRVFRCPLPAVLSIFPPQLAPSPDLAQNCCRALSLLGNLSKGVRGARLGTGAPQWLRVAEGSGCPRSQACSAKEHSVGKLAGATLLLSVSSVPSTSRWEAAIPEGVLAFMGWAMDQRKGG